MRRLLIAEHTQSQIRQLILVRVSIVKSLQRLEYHSEPIPRMHFLADSGALVAQHMENRSEKNASMPLVNRT